MTDLWVLKDVGPEWEIDRLATREDVLAAIGGFEVTDRLTSVQVREALDYLAEHRDVGVTFLERGREAIDTIAALAEWVLRSLVTDE